MTPNSESFLGFYFDNNSGARDLVAGLRAQGLACTTAFEAGQAHASDEEQLQYAATRYLVLVTEDISNFPPIHWSWLSAGKPHSGIILVQQGRFTTGDLIRLLARSSARADLANNLTWLTGE